jgi:hypothetical protein
MGDTPHPSGERALGRVPERRRTGPLGEAATVLAAIALSLPWPR